MKQYKDMNPLERNDFIVKLYKQFREESEAIMSTIDDKTPLDTLLKAKEYLNEALQASKLSYPDVPRMDITGMQLELTRKINILDGTIKVVN